MAGGQPADPPSPPSRQQGDCLAGAAPRFQRSRKAGLRCGDADDELVPIVCPPQLAPRSSLGGFPQGARPSAGSALGWEYLTPHPAPDRPLSRQNGLCFQPKSITHIHTPPTWRRPVCTSTGVTGRIGVLRAGGEGLCRQEKGGVSCRKGGWCAVGSTSSQEGSRPSLRPPGPGQGLERLVFPASLELVSFDWVCGSHLSGQSPRQRGTGFPAGQASFQIGWKVSTFGDAPRSSEPRASPGAETLLLLFPTG